MQIFPSFFEARSTSALNGVSVAADKTLSGAIGDANEFLDTLNAELARGGVTPVRSETGTPAGFRAVSLDSGSLKSEDLQDLRAGLKKRGLKDEELASLDAMISSGRPLTLGVLVNALSGKKRSTADLTEEERVQLGSALRKMGFSQDEAAGLERMMDQGKGASVMRTINRRLSAMDSDARLSLDKAEAQSLARGLELSDKTTQKMMALFGENEQINVNKAGMAALFTHANKEVAEKSQALSKLGKELSGAVDDVLKRAKFREATADDADARAGRKAERSEARISDKLTAKSNDLGPEALAERIRRTAKDARAEDEAAEEDREQRRESARKAFPPRREGSEGAAGARGEESRARRSADGNAIAAVAAEGAFSVDTSSGSGAAARPESVATPVRQEIFSQVEKGLLRELSDGSRQLVLRLDPEELGRVTLLLTVRQGEVRAILRTDNEETTAALSQQMAQLKTSLEEQGLKVAQLEVETRLADNMPDQRWGGAAQYNQEQELREQARFLQLARLRQEEGNGLARNMQNTSVTAGVREEISGLHIIA